ncbi:MAG: synthase protein [Phycisphaerales bacterium]|jgi:ATP synthase protein I|nr:synthase protein [Phycisphaerales bacterium]MEA2734003.1 synthase protein [Humisphaera sp.]
MASPPSDDHDDAGKRTSEDATLASWYRMAGVGIEFVVAIALFVGIGYAIDRWRGSSPWGILIGAGIGFAVGLRSMIRVAMKSFKE